jgi:hypothetical protein
MDLGMKYEKAVNGTECIDEIFDFQHIVQSIISGHIKCAIFLELLQLIQESYSNVDIVLRIFLTIPITVAMNVALTNLNSLRIISDQL